MGDGRAKDLDLFQIGLQLPLAFIHLDPVYLGAFADPGKRPFQVQPQGERKFEN